MLSSGHAEMPNCGCFSSEQKGRQPPPHVVVGSFVMWVGGVDGVGVSALAIGEEGFNVKHGFPRLKETQENHVAFPVPCCC